MDYKRQIIELITNGIESMKDEEFTIFKVVVFMLAEMEREDLIKAQKLIQHIYVKK